jgi:hypothetical protein
MDTSALFNGYHNWIIGWKNDGRKIWFGTLMFNSLGLNKLSTISLMQHEMERIYITMLTNIVRNPKSRPSSELPILIGAPDSPVFKRRPSLRYGDLAPNEGMHYHFLLGEPPISRLKIPLNQHIMEKQNLYVGNRGLVRIVDLRPVTDIRKNLADYTFKHIKRGTYNLDDILIVPATVLKT